MIPFLFCLAMYISGFYTCKFIMKPKVVVPKNIEEVMLYSDPFKYSLHENFELDLNKNLLEFIDNLTRFPLEFTVSETTLSSTFYFKNKEYYCYHGGKEQVSFEGTLLNPLEKEIYFKHIEYWKEFLDSIPNLELTGLTSKIKFLND